MKQKLIFTNEVGAAVDAAVAGLGGCPKVFVLVDANTASFVLPALAGQSRAVAGATVIRCKAGDANKNIESLAAVWKSLTDGGATRLSVLVNVGGGVVTDLGGFAAATFKRGIHCINVPSTLLGAVDAAVGGKTGINFGGYKNEVGVFSEAEAVVVSTVFFSTLPAPQLLSGYAEMLKHGLLEGRAALGRLLEFGPLPERGCDLAGLLPLVEESVAVKARIVSEDFEERGLRKALNLGHTAGHAFETLALERLSPVPHGYAVAWGLVVELVLSHLQKGFPSALLSELAAFVRDNYGSFDISCDDYPRLLEIMSHDKKNLSPEAVNFTLLEDAGRPVTDCTASAEQIKAALDIYRDFMGI